MEPVATALVATLLPTCLLIFILLCLSGYLYFQLHQSRVSTTAAENEENPAESTGAGIVEDFDWTKRESHLQKAADRAWHSDAISAMLLLPQTCDEYDHRLKDSFYEEPESEAWAAELLADLGYTGGLPVPTILYLLRQSAVNHLVVNKYCVERDYTAAFVGERSRG